MIVDKINCVGCNKKKCIINKYCGDDLKSVITEAKQDFLIEAEQVIFKEGQKVLGIYLIYSGKVKVLNTLGNKQESIIRFASDGDILGHRGYGGKDPVYPVSAITLERSHVAFIPNEVFMNALQTNAELCFSLMMFYADELKKSEIRTAKQIYMPTLNRIAASLLMAADTFGYAGKTKKLAFSPSRTDLAKMTNTTYASLIRGIKELEGKKYITLQKKEIIISNEEKLRELAM
ncbi:MAG: Crp/Fnr family transcriptional regulator [Cyclobacteriaceae bacterium]|nr:Crp/Fnr family transcriptional regulator [Cyclobacteriaceae bacterium]